MPKADPKRAAGGRILGKSARRARVKNAEAVEEYLTVIESARDADEVDRICRERGLMLACVARPQGMGRLEVRLVDGRENISVPIGGSIKFRGGSATKGDLDNCMSAGDLIVIRGSFAAGKFHKTTAIKVRGLFKTHGIGYPSNFFPAEDGSRDDLFDHDESEHDDEEEVDVDAV